jgi:hypothetical protein
MNHTQDHQEHAINVKCAGSAAAAKAAKAAKAAEVPKPAGAVDVSSLINAAKASSSPRGGNLLVPADAVPPSSSSAPAAADADAAAAASGGASTSSASSASNNGSGCVQIVIRRLPDPPARKTIFYIRHAESKWNKASHAVKHEHKVRGRWGWKKTKRSSNMALAERVVHYPQLLL